MCGRSKFSPEREGQSGAMAILLLIIGAALVLVLLTTGIYFLIARRSTLRGVILIGLGLIGLVLLVGPGGVSVFNV